MEMKVITTKQRINLLIQIFFLMVSLLLFGISILLFSILVFADQLSEGIPVVVMTALFFTTAGTYTIYFAFRLKKRTRLPETTY